jgi:hypothetical protein
VRGRWSTRATSISSTAVEADRVRGLDDVQRVYLLLRPKGARKYRLLIVGRKRLPDPGRHDRFWAFVYKVFRSRAALGEEFGEVRYRTKTLGPRDEPGARPVAEGDLPRMGPVPHRPRRGAGGEPDPGDHGGRGRAVLSSCDRRHNPDRDGSRGFPDRHASDRPGDRQLEVGHARLAEAAGEMGVFPRRECGAAAVCARPRHPFHPQRRCPMRCSRNWNRLMKFM